jgi:uncharacterized protein YcbK (DUF882 family)
VPNRSICQLRFASPSTGLLRTGQSIGIAALALLISCASLQNAAANGDTRTLSFKHLHTGELLTITYKREGRYDDEALKKIDWELRDWRRNEAVRIDPKVLDAVWELYREVGATEPIEIICGYRAPATNAMLRRRSNGVARFSQHTLGKAIDLHIPGVSLAKQREAAIRLQRGGVGYYPSSTFIHVDVGSIRHWPRMTYAQLSKVFPDGRTVHLPSNGKPLRNYKLALADVARGGRSPSPMSNDSARTAGVDVSTPRKRPTLLAKLFGGGRDAEEVEDNSRTNAAPAARQSAPAKVALATTIPGPRANPRRSIEPAAIEPAPVEQPIQTASADGFIPQSSMQEQTARTTPWPLREANNDRVPLELALAYAADLGELPTSSVAQTGTIAAPADLSGAENTARHHADNAPEVLVKKSSARLTAGTTSKATPRTTIRPSVAVTAGMRFDDPWLRAAMFAPSLYTSFTTSLSGEPDYASLLRLMDKPEATVKMTFSDNPNPGLTSDRFSGGAVVFVSTVTFQHTAALQ